MRKIHISLFCMAFLLCCFFKGSCQLSLGAKAGLSFASQNYSGFDSDFKTGILPGLMIGGIAEYDITDKVSVGSGLQLMTKGYTRTTDGEDYKLTFMYVQIPLQVQYKRDDFFGGIGFYVGMALGSKYVEEDGDTAKPDLGSELSDDFGRSDFGLNLEAGYSFTPNLRGSVSYSAGLANIIPGEAKKVFDGSIKNNVLGFSMAYFFNLK